MFDALKNVTDTTETSVPSLGAQAGKSFVINAAASAGLIAGFVALGAVKNWFDGREARQMAETVNPDE